MNQLDKWSISDQAPDILFCNHNRFNFSLPSRLSIILKDNLEQICFLTTENFFELDSSKFENKIIIYSLTDSDNYQKIRSVFFHLIENNISNPVVLKKDYKINSSEEIQLLASHEIGGLFLDGFGDGLWLTHNGQNLNNLAFNILQATRTRISKTEYISCPSCGRTLFDLQETTAKIRKETDHLKGVKIGIMGCIVNGPGEMADADFGYVGTGENKISLYKGQKIVKKNIPSEFAVDELISLIKENGEWNESNL